MDHKSIENPSNKEALDFIQEKRKENCVLIIFTECDIDFTSTERDFSSYCGFGEKYIVIKPDGVVKLNSEEGVRPVNWQTSGNEFNISLDSGCVHLSVTSKSKNGYEKIDSFLQEIYRITSYKPEKTTEKTCEGTEEDMKEKIFNDPSLIEEGFEPKGVEKKTDKGKVDMVGVDSDGTRVLIELKRSRAKMDYVYQLKRYVDHFENERGEEVRAFLVSPSFPDDIIEMLEKDDLEYSVVKPTAVEDAETSSRTDLDDF